MKRRTALGKARDRVSRAKSQVFQLQDLARELGDSELMRRSQLARDGLEATDRRLLDLLELEDRRLGSVPRE